MGVYNMDNKALGFDYEGLGSAINVRRSRRKYTGTPIAGDTAIELQRIVDQYSESANVRFELALNDSATFNMFTKSYGMFSGVNDYIAAIVKKGDETAKERVGYFGQLIVLQATNLGLGTCWVGISSNVSAMPFSLADDEELACTILVGNVDRENSPKEKFVRSIIHRKTKHIEEMYRFMPESDVSATDVLALPDWFNQGMLAVQRAPSAKHCQPVMFSYSAPGIVTASVPNYDGPFEAFDLGIAKAHFQIGVGGGSWNWGNDGTFIV